MITATNQAPQCDVDLEFITPRSAELLLKKNTNNRNLNKKHVDFLAHAMATKDYVFNGDPLRFDTNGTLLDGQHRLSAVVQSGEGQWFLVVRDLLNRAMNYIDVNSMTRRNSQVLSLNGVGCGIMVSSSLLLIKIYDNHKADTWRKISSGEAVEFVKNNPLIEEAAVFVNSKKNWPIVQSVLCAFTFLCARDMGAIPETFLENLRTGQNLDAGDPLLALRNWAYGARAKGASFSDRPSRVTQLAKVIKTYNNWRLGIRKGANWVYSSEKPLPRIGR